MMISTVNRKTGTRITENRALRIKLINALSFSPQLLLSSLFVVAAILNGQSTAYAADPGAKFEGAKLDPALPAYKKTSGVTGTINSIGSDTLNNLMTLWGEKMKANYPNIRIQVEGKGSGTAPPALIEGTAQLAPMSRAMKDSEIELFEKKYGYKPVQIRVAVDALAVFVQKDNPLQSLTLAQVDAIFSKSRRRGAPAEITVWKQAGLSGSLGEKAISLFGRNSASGTYGYFKEHALQNGDFRDTVKEQPGSASVVQGVAVDPAGIGYSGVGYLTSGVRALSLAQDTDPPVAPTQEAAYSGDYPLSRFLFVYINKQPGKPLDPLTHEFFRLALSKDGQEVVIKDGYYPVPHSVIEEDLAQLQ